MNSLEPVLLSCPYCGEKIEVLVDCSVVQQEYIEDCWVCCQPIVMSVACDGEDVSVQVRKEDDC